MENKEEWIWIAKIAEKAERYEEMVEAMKHVVEISPFDLNVEERNLFSIAFKNIIGARRASWRIVTSIEQKEQQSGRGMKSEKCTKYREKIEKELATICQEIIAILDHIMSGTTDDLARVFFLKMKGDYYRYYAEITTGAERAEHSRSSRDAYEASRNQANVGLRPTNPVRLGLALSHAIFSYDILNLPDIAFEIAQQAFNDAVAELDELDEDNYKDATQELCVALPQLLCRPYTVTCTSGTITTHNYYSVTTIMSMLRDNMILWSETSDEYQGEMHA